MRSQSLNTACRALTMIIASPFRSDADVVATLVA
jgi:hypothetical protein